MTTCGSYELVELIGEGSSGAVFRAQPVGGGDTVALKRLLHPLPSTLKAQLQQLKSSTSSPHLCQFAEIGISPEGEHYIVYPLLSGGDLEARRADFEKGCVPLRMTLRWSIDVLRGLEALHQAGYLHGDIKPSNLMLDHESAVVCDFSTLTPLSGPWEGDLNNGTPEYLPSEESLLRLPQRDLHALGLTMMGLLTGKLVTSVEDAVPSVHDPLLPAAVDDIVARAVGLSTRFNSAVEMRQALEALLTGPAPERTSLSPPTRRVVWEEKSHSRPLWPWLVALLMLGLGAWARSWQPAETVSAPPPTALWSGIGVAPAAVENQLVWQVLVLGRPVAAFSAPDPAAGGESARDRALWCAAVLEEAHFQKRVLKLVLKRELPESCEVYLQVPNEPDKFLFRITPSESKLFDRKAPLVAKAWSTLIADTANLARPGASHEKKGPSALLLTPWQRRFETLVGQRGELDQPTRIALLWEALDSLPAESREELVEAYRKLPEEPK